MYDIVGEELDISGDELESAGETGFLPILQRGLGPIFGQRPAAPAGPAGPAAVVPAARQIAQAVPAQTYGPNVVPRASIPVIRRQILPIPATALSPGGQATVTLQPQRGFRVEKLVLSSTGSPSGIVVSDITVGAERQFVASGDVPIAAFTADAVGTQLRGDTAQPGVTVSITLRNLGSAAETVSGAFFGASVE